MTTIDSFAQDYLLVLTVGGLICVSMWFFARRLIHRSRLWRAAFCILVAATILPTCFPSVFGGVIIAPSTMVALCVFERDTIPFALLFGVLPILAVAGLIFVLWSVIVWRRHRHESHVA